MGTIFLNTVSSIIPITSSSPLIATYFNAIMFMVAASVVTAILVLNYHHRLADTHEMPEWVQIIFLQWIPWFLRMSRPGKKITRKTIMMQKKMKEMEQKEISSKSLLANVLDIDDSFHSSNLNHSNHPSHVKPPIENGYSLRSPDNLSDETLNQGPMHPLHRELCLILKEIKVITDKIKDDDDSSTIESDWKFAAMVLDRLCLIVYTVFTIVATVAMLMTAPHVFV